MLCNIKYVHVAPANTGGLIDYSLYSGHLQYPKNDPSTEIIKLLSIINLKKVAT